uniref:Uncharacterized protein n=1 Tax=Arundo donax TaxID=35708 RepID=A0A0A9F8P4_ARUDO
MRTPCSRAT